MAAISPRNCSISATMALFSFSLRRRKRSQERFCCLQNKLRKVCTHSASGVTNRMAYAAIVFCVPINTQAYNSVQEAGYSAFPITKSHTAKSQI